MRIYIYINMKIKHKVWCEEKDDQLYLQYIYETFQKYTMNTTYTKEYLYIYSRSKNTYGNQGHQIEDSICVWRERVDLKEGFQLFLLYFISLIKLFININFRCFFCITYAFLKCNNDTKRSKAKTNFFLYITSKP